MTAPGTRVSRTNHRHLAIVREAREQLDRIDPDWRHKLIERQRANRPLSFLDRPRPRRVAAELGE